MILTSSEILCYRLHYCLFTTRVIYFTLILLLITVSLLTENKVPYFNNVKVLRLNFFNDFINFL